MIRTYIPAGDMHGVSAMMQRIDRMFDRFTDRIESLGYDPHDERPDYDEGIEGPWTDDEIQGVRAIAMFSRTRYRVAALRYLDVVQADRDTPKPYQYAKITPGLTNDAKPFDRIVHQWRLRSREGRRK